MRIRFRAPAATILVIAGLVTLGPAAGRADAPLALHVTPHVANAPATLMIRATVERHEENRGLKVEIVSNDYSRSSFVQLDGLAAPRTTTMTYPEVPGGIYEVRTTVVGPGGAIRATVSREIRVLSRSDA